MLALTIIELTHGHKLWFGIVLVLILLLCFWFLCEPANRRQARLARKNAYDLSYSLLDYLIDGDGTRAGLVEANRLNSEAATLLAKSDVAFRQGRYADCVKFASAASSLLKRGLDALDEP